VATQSAEATCRSTKSKVIVRGQRQQTTHGVAHAHTHETSEDTVNFIGLMGRIT